ncbi:hypothetical protein BBO_07459 [Beauveria brongniartii RCEF 3172]|uniref:Clr5 domain-containing protein n=1 Tax=Beauveria brongniartii RCEF 3172 TaxID=1081107 RepID=A0A166ZBF8_9HYPO|nr:hypothetical protein BBO_07459 [Beauveria brongniartii RCEF 3172]
MNIPGPPLFGEGFQEPINSDNYGASARNFAGRVSAAPDHGAVAVPRDTDNLTHHSSKEWEDQKETIIELFICQDIILKDVVSVMKAQGFHASAKQYRARFAAWHVRKNLNPSHKRIIAHIWLWRKQKCGQETAFIAWSRLVPEHQLKAIVKKYAEPLGPDDPTLMPPPFWLYYCTPPWINPSDGLGELATPSTSSDLEELLHVTTENNGIVSPADRELFQFATPDPANLPTHLRPNPEEVSLDMNTMHQLLPAEPAETTTYPLCFHSGSCAGPAVVSLVNAASNQHQQTAEDIPGCSPNNEAGDQAVDFGGHAVNIYPRSLQQLCGQYLSSFPNAFVADGGFDQLSVQVNAPSQIELSGMHEQSLGNPPIFELYSTTPSISATRSASSWAI